MSFINRFLQSAIRLCLLTSVTFLVTACYAPAYYDPELEPDGPMTYQDQAEEQLNALDLTNPEQK